jgi:hypothetical protein
MGLYDSKTTTEQQILTNEGIQLFTDFLAKHLENIEPKNEAETQFKANFIETIKALIALNTHQQTKNTLAGQSTATMFLFGALSAAAHLDTVAEITKFQQGALQKISAFPRTFFLAINISGDTELAIAKTYSKEVISNLTPEHFVQANMAKLIKIQFDKAKPSINYQNEIDRTGIDNVTEALTDKGLNEQEKIQLYINNTQQVLSQNITQAKAAIKAQEQEQAITDKLENPEINFKEANSPDAAARQLVSALALMMNELITIPAFLELYNQSTHLSKAGMTTIKALMTELNPLVAKALQDTSNLTGKYEGYFIALLNKTNDEINEFLAAEQPDNNASGTTSPAGDFSERSISVVSSMVSVGSLGDRSRSNSSESIKDSTDSAATDSKAADTERPAP